MKPLPERAHMAFLVTRWSQLIREYEQGSISTDDLRIFIRVIDDWGWYLLPQLKKAGRLVHPIHELFRREL